MSNEMVISATAPMSTRAYGMAWGLPLSYNGYFGHGWSTSFGGFQVTFDDPSTSIQTDDVGNPASFTVDLGATFTLYMPVAPGEKIAVASGLMPSFSYSSTLSNGDSAYFDGVEWHLGVHGSLNPPYPPLGPFGAFVSSLDRIVYHGSSGDDQFEASYLETNTVMDGGPGNDSLWGAFRYRNELSGGAGDDFLVGQGIGDVLDGGEDNDEIQDGDAYGDATVPPPQAHYNDDTLLGGAGNDHMVSAGGNDFLDGGSGDDQIFASAAEAGNDTLVGGAGTNILHGGAGLDIALYSGTRSDYSITAGSTLGYEWTVTGPDAVDHLGQIELLKFSDGYTVLAQPTRVGTDAGQSLKGDAQDNVIDAKGGNDKLFGLAGFDILLGGDGDDKLDGGAGADIMFGGAGNDSYVVDNPADVADETAAAGGDAGGVDAVKSSVTFQLADFIEYLTLTGTDAVDGTGNVLANKLTGNSEANRLEGRAGADSLSGGGGDDTLAGGPGSDQLKGGLGGDTFIFAADGSVDKVTDFSGLDDTVGIVGQEFGIAAGPLDPSYFRLVSRGETQGDAVGHGQFLYDSATRMLLWDDDGAGVHPGLAIATFNKGVVLSSNDIIVL